MSPIGQLATVEVRAWTAADLRLPSLPQDGARFLQEAQRHAGQRRQALVLPAGPWPGGLRLSLHSAATGPWYGDRQIGFILCPGDLLVDGDLLDDDFSAWPMLVVQGDLVLHNWLRGGMAGFVGGGVRASGFVVGRYNDAPLFVGGDLEAAGFIPRMRSDRRVGDGSPHQVAGQWRTRRFDAEDASAEDLQAAFVDEVLDHDEEGPWLDDERVLERARAGLPVWR